MHVIVFLKLGIVEDQYVTCWAPPLVTNCVHYVIYMVVIARQ